jgi:hypothetical protein
MKPSAFLLLLVLLCGSLAGVGQTLKQCKTSANGLFAVKSSGDFSAFSKTMTAGDELQLSTNLARCLDHYRDRLTPQQFDRLDRMVYTLDADVISRMFDFLERHNLSDKFNDEEQARKVEKLPSAADTDAIPATIEYCADSMTQQMCKSGRYTCKEGTNWHDTPAYEESLRWCREHSK